MRCAALATALRLLGWRVGVASRSGAKLMVPALASEVDDYVEFAGVAGSREVAEMKGVWPDGVDLLVVDHYEHGANFEQDCLRWARRILAIDDLADRLHDCNFLLNQNPGSASRACATPIPSPLRESCTVCVVEQQGHRSRSRVFELGMPGSMGAAGG